MYEASCFAFTIYAGVLVWLLVDWVSVHVATSRFRLEREKGRWTPKPPLQTVGVQRQQ